MKIGMLGGTFNPPHMGHIELAREAVKELELDMILLVPTGKPPHKYLDPESATAEQRYQMTLLAAKHIPKAEVSRIEIDREGASYTSDTLIQLKQIYKDTGMILIMGSDMFLTLDKWHEAENIFPAAQIAVASRKGREEENIKRMAAYYTEKFGADIVRLGGNIIEISSTQLRKEIKSGNAGKYLPSDIAEYIKENGLYVK